MRPFLPYSQGAWRGFAAQTFREANLTADALENMGELVVDKPNRVVRRMHILGGEAYAKWFSPPRNILKQCFRRPLAFRLLDIHLAMLEAGIGCAIPCLAAVEGRLGRQLFVYRAIPFPGLHIQLREADAEKANTLYLAAAQAIAQLHRRGFVHGDCLPGNICLAEDGTAFFIDNDRTAKSFFPLRQYQERRNLIQFCAHAAIQCGMTPEQQRLFLEHYYSQRDQDIPSLDSLVDVIERRREEIQQEMEK